jgi:hypothetical protein
LRQKVGAKLSAGTSATADARSGITPAGARA